MKVAICGSCFPTATARLWQLSHVAAVAADCTGRRTPPSDAREGACLCTPCVCRCLVTAPAAAGSCMDEDVQPLMDLFRLAQEKGETSENAMKVPMQAILVSPDFLFRVEGGADASAPHRALGDFELASRLFGSHGAGLDARRFRL